MYSTDLSTWLGMIESRVVKNQVMENVYLSIYNIWLMLGKIIMAGQHQTMIKM